MDWNALGQMTRYTDCSGKTTRYDYDAAGHLAMVTDALGQSTRFERLPTGEPVRITLPDASVQEYRYDTAGLLVMQRYREAESRWLRNARGQVVEAIDPAERRLLYRYDARGRLQEFKTDPATRYGFEYDAGDRLRREVRPDGVERLLRYDAAGELAAIDKLGSITAGAPERARRTTRFERDKMGRLLVQETATSVSTYAWNVADGLVSAERVPTAAGAAVGVNASSVSFDYDNAGRLLAEHGVEGTVAYELDALDNIAALVLPYGQRFDMLSYGSGHVHQIRMGERVISDFERDDLHREVLRTQGRLTQRTGYDQLGRRSWQAAGFDPAALGPGTGQFWRSYRYNRLGELAEQRDSVRGRLTYHYDPAGHLLRQVRDVEPSEERFAWDAAGNLLEHGHGKSAGRVEGNRLMVWGDIRFDYDPWGNVRYKRKGSRLSQRFIFDAEDRLVAVVSEDGQGVTESRFDYDPIGRRIGSKDTRQDIGGSSRVARKRFVWQGLCMAQEVREGSVSSYLYSPQQIYTPLARVDAVFMDGMTEREDKRACGLPRIYYFHTDTVGMPLELTDEIGKLAWTGRYAAWGKFVREEGTLELQRTDQMLRYPGQYEDSAIGLHYNTFRYYDPDVGRYISQDPIGLVGGVSLYGYSDAPTRHADPLGWCSTKLGKRMGATRGDGMANHHLIPEELLKHGDYQKMFNRLRSIGFDGDGPSNGMFLPGSERMAKLLAMPGHWSGHSHYTNQIRRQLDHLNNMFKCWRLSDMQLALGIKAIQRSAVDGLEQGKFLLDQVTGRLL